MVETNMTVTAVVLCVSSILGSSESPRIAKPQLLEVLRASEASYSNIEFEATKRFYKVDQTGRRLTKESTQHANLRIRLALPAGGRYFLDFEGHVNSVTKTDPTPKPRPIRYASAYNGRVATRMDFYKRGGEWTPLDGLITDKRDHGNLVDRVRVVFLDLIAPFYREKGLASYLEKADWQICSQQGDVVEIRLPAEGEPSCDFVLKVDLSKGANIVSFEKWHMYGTDSPTQLTDADVELRREGTHWVPKRATYHSCQYYPKLGRSAPYHEIDVTFKTFRCNQQLSDDAFMVQFPAWLRVSNKGVGVPSKVPKF